VVSEISRILRAYASNGPSHDFPEYPIQLRAFVLEKEPSGTLLHTSDLLRGSRLRKRFSCDAIDPAYPARASIIRGK
jgi:hypothetical protein